MIPEAGVSVSRISFIDWLSLSVFDPRQMKNGSVQWDVNWVLADGSGATREPGRPWMNCAVSAHSFPAATKVRRIAVWPMRAAAAVLLDNHRQKCAVLRTVSLRSK